MHRDLHALSSRSFELLVVGGGIYGLITACDAAQRGLSVALVEQRDFASGNSFNHLRTIHGGLRYLQTMDLARARESIVERRTLARIAAPAVQPLRFVLPLTRSLGRGRLAMRAGFALDGVISRDRNADVAATHQLPAGGVLNLAEAFARFPELQRLPKLTGAAVWYDYVTADAERLTLSWLTAAVAHDAVAANYVEAVALHISGGRVTGVQALDHRSGNRFDIQARVVVNATCGAIDRLLIPAMVETRLPMMRAMNLVTRRDSPPYALGGRSGNGRNLFTVPYRGRLLVGTWESGVQVADARDGISAADVASFLTEINEAFPYLALTREDVTLVHEGVVPAMKKPDGSYVLEGRDQIHDHGLSGLEGIISVAGTKYTTARRIAERVVDAVVEKLGRAALPCRTATLPLPITFPTGDQGLVESAQNEAVETLEDVVMRRLPIGQLGDPGDAVLTHAAGVVGQTLGWPMERRLDEAASLRERYGRLNALIT